MNCLLVNKLGTGSIAQWFSTYCTCAGFSVLKSQHHRTKKTFFRLLEPDKMFIFL